MQNQSKGMIEIYDEACIALSEEPFYTWLNSSEHTVGQVCMAPAWYEKNYRWYLDSATYNPYKEDEATWFAKQYPANGTVHLTKPQPVQKFFQLEKDERMIATHCKRRPVVLIKKTGSDWFNKTESKSGWLCFPAFKYRPRHNQQYVLEDQALERPLRFYLPKIYKSNPGMALESALHLDFMQVIEEKYLQPVLIDNLLKKQRIKYGVSEFGMKLIIVHLYKFINLIDAFIDDSSKEDKTYYDLFVDCIREGIHKAVQGWYEKNSVDSK